MTDIEPVVDAVLLSADTLRDPSVAMADSGALEVITRAYAPYRDQVVADASSRLVGDFRRRAHSKQLIPFRSAAEASAGAVDVVVEGMGQLVLGATAVAGQLLAELAAATDTDPGEIMRRIRDHLED